MRLLITGPTGKVGAHLLSALPTHAGTATAEVVALCHNRGLEAGPGVTVVRGSLADPEVVARALDGVTHVVHLAAVKESPDQAIDVAVKGLFLLLEEFCRSATAERFLLLSGDCAVGHAFQPYPGPITEESPRRPYPGCYALTKVLEESMIEAYGVQHGLDWTCLRAPWIMEKDDLRYAFSFGPDQFGGPPWTDFLPADEVARLAEEGAVPLMLDAGGRPLLRGFLHVDDLVSAILAALLSPAARGQLFNVALDEPVDYGRAARHLRATRGLPVAEVPTPLHGNWLSNAKARQSLGWRPNVHLEEMIERAWTYARPPNEPRKVWYPG